MLRVVCLTTLISAIHPLKWCVYFRYRKNCNHPFFEVNVPFLVVVPLFVTRCHSLSFIVTRCTTRCHSLSLVVPFVVSGCTTRCHLLYHSLLLVVIRCHSLSLDEPLVCLFMNDLTTTDLAFARFTYPFFFSIYLRVRLRKTWNIKVTFCSNKKRLTRTCFVHLRYP